ncbi:MAG: hypothetical protein RMH93_02665 [Aquificaceae bacterium]|nr:hypothetical protein [Aquificaceae bacterium]
MDILCLLLDKERKYSSLLADVFSITGHKLLIALDEEKALELLKMASPDVVLLPVKDIPFWFRLLEIGKNLSPVFFLEKHEDMELIRRYGLREVNCVVLPFNPMELLTKVVTLNKEPKEPAHLEAIGPTNALLKLLRLGVTASLLIEGQEQSCALYLRNGVLVGSNCNTQELLNLLPEDVKVKVEPYREYTHSMEWLFGNNWSFFSSLMQRHMPEVIPTPEEVLPPQEVPTAQEKGIDLDQPVELGKDFYWVGTQDREGLFQKNAYLRIYGRESIRVPILINLGTQQDYILVRTKLEQIVSSVNSIKGVVLLGSGVDEASGILEFLQANHRAFVITSLSIAHRLRSLGIPNSRIRTIESLPGGRLKLASGEVLRFIPTPFLPEPGSFAVLEESRGYLFTGRFLSSLSTLEEFNPLKNASIEDILIYASSMVSSQEVLNAFLRRSELDSLLSIYPMFGNPVLSEEGLRALFSKLERLVVYNRSTQVYDRGHIIDVCESLIHFLRENLEVRELEAFFEELNQFLYLENSKILQLFVEAHTLPSLMLSVMHSKRLKPRFTKEAIKHFYLSGVPFTI